MSVFRVIIKDVKKCTTACDACRRRKGRCDGGSPCGWCASHKVECLVSNTKRRGPKRGYDDISQELDIVDKREMAMLTEMELSRYIDLYQANAGKSLLSMPWDLAHTTDDIDLRNPKTFCQLGRKYALSAVVARACGHRDRATQLIQAAKYFVAQAFDSMTVDMLRCYLIMAAYWLSTDFRLFKFYMMMARNVFTSLPERSLPEPVRAPVDLITAYFGNNIPSDRGNIAVLCESSSPAQQLVCLNATLINIGVTILGPIHELKLGNTRVDILSILTSQVVYSQAQRQGLLDEINICKSFLDTPYFSECKILHLQLKCHQCFVEWRSKNIQAALPLAIEIASMCSSESFMFGNRHDIEILLPISIFLCEQQLYDLAEKIYTIANSLHSCVCVDTSFSEGESTILQYIASQTPNSPPSPSLPLISSDPTTTVSSSTSLPIAQPNQLSSSIVSLARVLYAKSPNNLFSSADMQLLHTTIANIFPIHEAADSKRPIRLAADKSVDTLQITLSLEPHVTPPNLLISRKAPPSIPLISDNITMHGNIVLGPQKLLSACDNDNINRSNNNINTNDNIYNELNNILFLSSSSICNDINNDNTNNTCINNNSYEEIEKNTNITDEDAENKGRIPVMHYFTTNDGAPHEISAITNIQASGELISPYSFVNLISNPNSIGDDLFYK